MDFFAIVKVTLEGLENGCHGTQGCREDVSGVLPKIIPFYFFTNKAGLFCTDTPY